MTTFRTLSIDSLDIFYRELAPATIQRSAAAWLPNFISHVPQSDACAC